MKTVIIRWNLYLGALVLAVSAWLLASGSIFMHTWFYLFAWWPFILILDSVNYRWTGDSLFLRPRFEFGFMALISVSVWLVFELFNLRLRNWSYHTLPASLWARWLGYFLAFASVIPALQVLSAFFRHIFRKAKLPVIRLNPSPGLLKVCFGLGLILLVLPVIWPRLFFPCVWLGFLFLLEPINYRRANPSVLRDFEGGSAFRFWSWLAAGLTAGFLWEFFNYWAGSHWEYSLPYFEFGRIFQMPVLGYLGFLPFALEVFALYGLLFSVFEKGIRSSRAFIGAVIFLLAFDAGVFLLIDRFTWAK